MGIDIANRNQPSTTRTNPSRRWDGTSELFASNCWNLDERRVPPSRGRMVGHGKIQNNKKTYSFHDLPCARVKVGLFARPGSKRYHGVVPSQLRDGLVLIFDTGLGGEATLRGRSVAFGDHPMSMGGETYGRVWVHAIRR